MLVKDICAGKLQLVSPVPHERQRDVGVRRQRRDQPRTLEERRPEAGTAMVADICTVGAADRCISIWVHGERSLSSSGPTIVSPAWSCGAMYVLLRRRFRIDPRTRSRFWATPHSFSRATSIDFLPAPAGASRRAPLRPERRLVRTLAEGNWPAASTRLRGVARRTTVACPGWVYFYRMESEGFRSRRPHGCSCVRVFLRDARGIKANGGESKHGRGRIPPPTGLGRPLLGNAALSA